MARLIKLALLLVLLPAGTAIADKLPVWKIEGSNNSVLLMGSIHLLRSSDYPLPPGLDVAYEQADRLVMEVDTSSLDPMRVQSVLTSMGLSHSGGLRKTLGEDAYKDAAMRAEKLGIPFAMFDPMEPWFAALTITQLRMMQLGFDPSWGIETRLTQRAAVDGKTIVGLETLEEQLGFMANLDIKTQREFLLQSLDEAETVASQVTEMASAWRAGDTDVLEDLMLEGFEAAPGLEDALLIQRNRNWVTPILELQNAGEDYLVIVGAMHLVGEHSVLKMLADRGVTTRQLSAEDFR